MNKSTFQNVSVKQIAESKTNPRGTAFEGPEFNDLVASIKEKGIIVPLILRPAGKGYEVVAGSRRFRAAQKLKLTEVPANIQQLTDSEAQEVQIIENLQRADVHPLEEGQAYRKLVEESHYEVASVAAKVGKSESYVRQRIFLTRLEVPVAAAYRSGKIQDGHAVLIAKLSAADQLAALKWLTQWGDAKDIADLKSHIEDEFYKPLEYQPWLKDAEALAAVGPCKECAPTVPSLFGAVKEGACTDKKCWKRKIGKYIDFRKTKNPDLVLITQDYNYSRDDKENAKGILSANQYTKVGSKDKCEYSTLALVAQGRGLGSQIRVCVSSECKKHKRHSAAVSRMTPAEKAKREKEEVAEKARQEKKQQKDREEMVDALKKVKWPISRKTLDVLFEGALEDPRDLEELCERRGIELPEKDGYKDEEKAIRKAAEKMSDVEFARLAVELALMNTWNDDDKKKRIKML